MRRNLLRIGTLLQLMWIDAGATFAQEIATPNQASPATANPPPSNSIQCNDRCLGNLNLKRVILTFPATPAPAASAPAPAATTGTNIVVNVPPAIDRVVTNKNSLGVLNSTVADKALPQQTVAVPGPTAQLIYEAPLTPAPATPADECLLFQININPGATLDAIGIAVLDDNGAQIDGLIKDVQLIAQPSRTLVDNNNNDPTTVTTKFIDLPKAGKLTIRTKIQSNRTLRVTIPDTSVVASPISYLIERANELGQAYSLRRQISIVNGSRAPWKVEDGADLVMLDSAGKVQLQGKLQGIPAATNEPNPLPVIDNNTFSQLPHSGLPTCAETYSYTVVEPLNEIKVDTSHYVDLGTLLAGGKPSPKNVSQLPRVIKLENRSNVVVVPSGTQIQIRLVGDHAAATIGSFTLTADLAPKHGQNDIEKIPAEILTNVAFLSFGVDSVVQMMGANTSTTPGQPWLPLSVKDKDTLIYLKADAWGFHSIPGNVKFFDSRAGYIAVTLSNPNDGKQYVWSVSTSAATIPDPQSTTPADDWAKALKGFQNTNKLLAASLKDQLNPNGQPKVVADILPEIRYFYHLDPLRAFSLPGVDPTQKPIETDQFMTSLLFKSPLNETMALYSAASKASQDALDSLQKKKQILQRLGPYAGRNLAGVAYTRTLHEIQDLQFEIPADNDALHSSKHEVHQQIEAALNDLITTSKIKKN